jgi:hypothetical protein
MEPTKRRRARRHWSRIPVLASGAALLAVAATVTATGAFSRSPASAAVSPASSSTASCGWPREDTAATVNAFAPDSSAAYWVQPFTVGSGLRIALSGRYPDARYASFTVYTSSGKLFTENGIGSTLTDYLIQPDPGSANPWQRRGAAPGGRFTLTLTSDASPGQANELPLAPAGTAAGTTGYLVFRVYLPAGGDFAAVPLPAVTITRPGSTVTLRPCTGQSARPVTRRGGVSGALPGQAAQFSRHASSYIFPNGDSGYLTAAVPPPGAGNVVVISGKAPTWSAGNHPSPWPEPNEDVRYWSMCDYLDTGVAPLVENTLPDGKTDYGCRPDEDTRLNSQGYYTYVVGTEAQRTAIDAVPGVTFLPLSSADPTATSLLMLRNMLANSGFKQAIQNVPDDASPGSAQAVMGPYYPREAVCALSTLQARGPQACLSGS